MEDQLRQKLFKKQTNTKANYHFSEYKNKLYIYKAIAVTLKQI